MTRAERQTTVPKRNTGKYERTILGGEEVAAFVAPRQDGADAVSGDALISHCRERLAPYKAPRQIFLLDELPKNGVGKIRKDQLAARLPPL